MRLEPAGVGLLARPELVERRVVAAEQHRPAQGSAARHAVDPRARVAVVGVAGAHAVHDVVEVPCPLGVDPHEHRLDREEAHRHLGHDPGEAHPAGRRPEQLGVAVGADLLDALRRVQRRRLHVVGEAALDVVVLAVDVGGERSAHRHEARAR